MGWTRQGLALHVVDATAAPHMPAREKIFWRIGNGRATLEHPAPALVDWSIATDAMIGCFGVAPAGEMISTATSGRYGGNMDYRLFREGTTAYFPVAVEGAYFLLGDAHAAQGDGEIAGTGIETSAEIEVSVNVLKKTIGWPRGETAECIFTVGNARPLEQALQHATTEMLTWLTADYGLDTISASHLLGMGVRYDIANVFNPAFSVACRLEKSWLP
jgi:amidase